MTQWQAGRSPPISFRGTICFTDGMTDAAAFFGYFNRDDQVEVLAADDSDLMVIKMGLVVNLKIF